MKAPSYDLRRCSIGVVQDLCVRYHGYGGAGNLAVYAFAVYEGGRPVAAYAWQPPPPGAARSACPEQPSAVLALSRMVAVPRGQRELNHVSKPLRRQMRQLIDRHRWPVLATYHDEGQGHTGHVYQCSGWQKTRRTRTPVYEIDGVRVSSYSAGRHRTKGKERAGHTYIQRWEHWACDRGAVAEHMAAGGWRRVPVPGKTWRSGSQAYTWEQVSNDGAQLVMWSAR